MYEDEQNAKQRAVAAQERGEATIPKPVLIGARISQVANGFVVSKEFSYNYGMGGQLCGPLSEEKSNVSIFKDVEEAADHIVTLFHTQEKTGASN